jgi:hypothetical protein
LVKAGGIGRGFTVAAVVSVVVTVGVGVSAASVLDGVSARSKGATYTSASGLGWRAVVTGPKLQGLLAVLALSPADVWAVGGVSPQGVKSPVIVHWDGMKLRRFFPFRPTHAGEAALTAIAGVSPRDIWAVGYDGDYRESAGPVAMHWDGRTWKSVSVPTSGALKGVVAFAPNDVWAVGNRGGLTGFAMIVHWDGTRWTVVNLGREAPRETELDAIGGASGTDIWAAGCRYINEELYHLENFALHWNGRRWTHEQGWEDNSEGCVNAVDAGTPRDVWSLSEVNGGEAYDILHWNGREQRFVREDDESFEIADIAAVGRSDVWTVGDKISHWDGRSWWVSVPRFLKTACPACDPPTLNGLSALSPTDIWAVGDRVIARYSH